MPETKRVMRRRNVLNVFVCERYFFDAIPEIQREGVYCRGKSVQSFCGSSRRMVLSGRPTGLGGIGGIL